MFQQDDPELAHWNTSAINASSSQPPGKRGGLLTSIIAAALDRDARARPVCGGGHGDPTILGWMRKTLDILILFGLLGAITGCAPDRPARINHVVLFKLQEPAEAGELIADCDRELAVIPGVTSYFCGPPGDFGRDIVDSNYDVGFYVGFDTDEAYEAYLVDPRHVETVNKWKPRWEWIRIYDVMDETP